MPGSVQEGYILSIMLDGDYFDLPCIVGKSEAQRVMFIYLHAGLADPSTLFLEGQNVEGGPNTACGRFVVCVLSDGFISW